MSKPVVTIGEALIDLIAPARSDLRVAQSLVIREGGAPANVAVGLARLGAPVQIRTVVGQDQFGERLIVILKTEGVDCSHVRQVESPTTLALAWADENGNGQFQLIRGADTLLSPEDMEFGEIEAVVCGSVALTAEPCCGAVLAGLRIASERRIPVVFDVNIRPGLTTMDQLRLMVMAGLTSATVVKISTEDARHMWGVDSLDDVADKLDRINPPVAVITDGARGAMLRVGPTRITLPAFPVDAIEPTGAGDAFTAAFVSRMIARNWDGATADDLRFAMAAGALATTVHGAMEALPTLDEITEFLDAHPA